MMEVVRDWLMGITGAAILAAGADALMPDGGVKQIGRLLCGLVILVAVLSPLQGRLGERVGMLTVNYEAQLSGLTQELEADRSEQMKQLIEEELRAYSVDRMAREGMSCQLWVECALSEDGVYLPALVTVEGICGESERDTARRILSSELGINTSEIVFREGGVE